MFYFLRNESADGNAAIIFGTISQDVIYIISNT